MKAIAIIIGTLLIIVMAVSTNVYMQHFNQDSNNTATSGWVFRTTLNLDEYRNVSTGNGMWGKYDRYTRSDRHTETITVYCNQYCKK